MRISLARSRPKGHTNVEQLLESETCQPWQCGWHGAMAEVMRTGAHRGRRSSSLFSLYKAQQVAIIPQGTSRRSALPRRGSRLIELGHPEKPGSENGRQTRPHDLQRFRRGNQLTCFKAQFVLGWLRSSDAKQGRRAVIASNPPTGGEGELLITPWQPIFGTFDEHEAGRREASKSSLVGRYVTGLGV
jgi:hypothetical protein